MNCLVIFCLLLYNLVLFDAQNAKDITVKLCTKELARIKAPVYLKKHKETLNKYTMIIYVDKNDCPSCFISHLSEWDILIKECGEKEIPMGFMFIFSPLEKDNNAFVVSLASSSISYFSYIDLENKFRRNNPWLAKNHSMHIFIVDEHMKPTFIDAPPYDRRFMTWLQSL